MWKLWHRDWRRRISLAFVGSYGFIEPKTRKMVDSQPFDIGGRGKREREPPSVVLFSERHCCRRWYTVMQAREKAPKTVAFLFSSSCFCVSSISIQSYFFAMQSYLTCIMKTVI